MTKIFWTALILGLIGLLAACGSDDDNDDASGKPVVVATTVQITALTREVAGDNVALTGIIPAGADAHEFEPTASDLRAIEGADLILKHGIGLDDWLDDTLSANNDAQVITVTEGITLREVEEDGEVVDDPHVWHDPDNVKLMVDDIEAALSGADPDNQATYQANAEAYKQKLDDTKDEVRAIIDEIPQDDRKLVTNHDAIGYFAEAFGLEVVGTVIPSVTTGSEPSAQDTAELLDTIRREGVKAIFAESSVNASLAEALANDAGVQIVDDLYGDSLGESGSGAETVDGMLLANARKIADALK
jgi:ABC-type Zn uptake system ZnuABC Zn-binding protein ZnuA